MDALDLLRRARAAFWLSAARALLPLALLGLVIAWSVGFSGFIGDVVDAQAPVRMRPAYQATVGTSAAALPTSGTVLGVVIKCICPGQTVYLGTDNTVSSATGFPLADGDTFSPEVADASSIWAVATASGQKLAVFPYRRN